MDPLTSGDHPASGERPRIRIPGEPSLEGRAALVTGASRRIGAAIATRLASVGMDVVLHCRRDNDEIRVLADTIGRESGVQAHVVEADLASPDVADLVIRASRLVQGRLGVLVNNASIFGSDSAEDVGADTFDRHFAVNLRAPVILSSAFVSKAAPGGCIVNVLDQRVLRPTPRYFSYTLSKCGLRDATRTMAQQFGPLGFRVNAVAPGLTLINEHQDPREFQRRIDTLPLGTGGSAEEVAEAVVYLARSPSVTGQIVSVDGGQHVAWQTPDVSAPRERSLG